MMMVVNPVAIQPVFDLKKNNVTDTSYKLHSLTDNGTSSATGMFGESNGARDYNGTSNYINSTETLYDTIRDAYNSANGVTIVIDANIDSFSATKSLVFAGYDNGFTNSYFAGIEWFPTDYKVIYSGNGSTGNSPHSRTSLTTGSWQNIQVTIKKGSTTYTGAIYENGSAITMTSSNSNQLLGSGTDSSRKFYIGKISNRYIDGRVATVKVIPYKLTPNQIKMLSILKGRLN